MKKNLFKSVDDIFRLHKLASHVLIHFGQYVVFHDHPHRDFVKMGSISFSKDKCLLYAKGQPKSVVASDDKLQTRDLFQKVFKSSDAASFCSFTLADADIRLIQKSVQSINATRFVLFGDEDGVFFNAWNESRFHLESRPSRNHQTLLLTHQLKQSPTNKFWASLNAFSITELPVETLRCAIGKNQIVVFSDYESDDVYLFRDSEVSPPLINFFNDQLQEGISLSLSPKSNALSPDTSQPSHPESESAETDLDDLVVL